MKMHLNKNSGMNLFINCNLNKKVILQKKIKARSNKTNNFIYFSQKKELSCRNYKSIIRSK